MTPMIRKLAISLVLLACSFSAFAQNAKDPVSWLFLVNAKSVAIEGNKLILSNVKPNVVAFSDRPFRKAKYISAITLSKLWQDSRSADSFKKDPPNAVIVASNANGTSSKDMVVELTSAQYSDNKLTFTFKTLKGDLDGVTNEPSLFIDTGGLMQLVKYP